jgi:hypothetical protein
MLGHRASITFGHPPHTDRHAPFTHRAFPHADLLILVDLRSMTIINVSQRAHHPHRSDRLKHQSWTATPLPQHTINGIPIDPRSPRTDLPTPTNNQND